jgi:hypothetical protein
LGKTFKQQKGGTMALSEMEENDIKRMVLVETENMFTAISHKYNIKENQEMMYFLLDIESKMKQSLIELSLPAKSDD